MSVTTVALVRCESYQLAAVRQAVARGLRLLGGVGRFAQDGEQILIKPNLLCSDPPEKCTTTHPAVFQAIIERFQTTGAMLSYGDSPAAQKTKSVIKKTGLGAVAEALGVPLADFEHGREVIFEAGRQNKKFLIANGVLDCDGLISLPKLKPHGLELITGSVKNQFGCVPGFLKGEYHVKIPDSRHFAKMLVDLNRCIAPRLYVMDAIWAMEGNGPRGGRPRRMNLLLFATDPIALDATACRLIDVDPDIIPTIRYGAEIDHGISASENIKLVGDDFERFKTPDFDVRRHPIQSSLHVRHKGLNRLFNDHMVAKPVIRPGRCVRCGLCVKACPTRPRSLFWSTAENTTPPQHDYRRCIRCYCCQELCPESAIDLVTPPLRLLLARVHQAVTAIPNPLRN